MMYTNVISLNEMSILTLARKSSPLNINQEKGRVEWGGGDWSKSQLFPASAKIQDKATPHEVSLACP